MNPVDRTIASWCLLEDKAMMTSRMKQAVLRAKRHSNAALLVGLLDQRVHELREQQDQLIDKLFIEQDWGEWDGFSSWEK